MINADRYQQAKVIFFEACERPPSERDSFITTACHGDQVLRQWVLNLLEHDADPLSLNESSQWRAHLEQLADSSASAATAEAQASQTGDGHPIHKTIGGYRLIRQIGQGGMGVVYLAEQDNPRRQVALKVMAPGPISPAALRRFKQESQVLGRLHHPGIAQIFEAGADDAGHGSQPFFAMELVLGRPLLKYCEAARLNVRARLELFIVICEALEHAHQQGVIHRDLKPANILIDESATPPQPKILDFGVARATGGDLALSTMHTRADQLIGTVAYMSPEQLDGEGDSLDRRSDVYSLGVILFELLAGRLPHDLAGKTIPETIRIVGQEEPTMLGTLDRSYRGDVDTIVAKALERDRVRRYDSAGALAADLRRHLADEPILARPASTMYQFRKFARRNKTLMAGVAAVFLTLIMGMLATAWQWRKAVAARDEQITLRRTADDNAVLARREAAKAGAVNEFVRRMLSSAAPNATQGRDVSVGEVLDSAAAEVDGGALSAQPEVQAAVDLIIGESYLALTRTVEATRHLDRALQVSRVVHGERSAEVATTLVAIASVRNAEGNYAGAVTIAREAHAMFKELHRGVDHAETANALNNLAEYLSASRQMDEATAVFRESLAMLERLRGPDDLQVANVRGRLAGMLHNPAEAEPLLRACLEAYRLKLGELDTKHIQTMGTLAGIIMMGRRTDEAEAMLHRTLELARQTYGPDHAYNLAMLQNLAFCHDMAQQHPEGLAVRREALAMCIRLHGEENQRTINALMDLATGLAKVGEREAADRERRRSLAIARRLGVEHEQINCVSRLSIATEVMRQVAEGRPGDPDEARTLVLEVLAIEGTREPMRMWTRGVAESVLGEIALNERDHVRADDHLRRAVELIATNRVAVQHQSMAMERLARACDLWHAADPVAGKDAEAASWRAKAAELNAPKPPTKPAVP